MEWVRVNDNQSLTKILVCDKMFVPNRGTWFSFSTHKSQNKSSCIAPLVGDLFRMSISFRNFLQHRHMAWGKLRYPGVSRCWEGPMERPESNNMRLWTDWKPRPLLWHHKLEVLILFAHHLLKIVVDVAFDVCFFMQPIPEFGPVAAIFSRDVDVPTFSTTVWNFSNWKFLWKQKC